MTNPIYLEALASILHHAVPHVTKESVLQIKVLLYIAQHPDCCVRELAHKFGVNQSTISRATKALRFGKVRGRSRRTPKKGLIRCSNKHTKRHTYVLTEDGERYVSRLARRIPEANHRILLASV